MSKNVVHNNNYYRKRVELKVKYLFNYGITYRMLIPCQLLAIYVVYVE